MLYTQGLPSTHSLWELHTCVIVCRCSLHKDSPVIHSLWALHTCVVCRCSLDKDSLVSTACGALHTYAGVWRCSLHTDSQYPQPMGIVHLCVVWRCSSQDAVLETPSPNSYLNGIRRWSSWKVTRVVWGWEMGTTWALWLYKAGNKDRSW